MRSNIVIEKTNRRSRCMTHRASFENGALLLEGTYPYAYAQCSIKPDGHLEHADDVDVDEDERYAQKRCGGSTEESGG